MFDTVIAGPCRLDLKDPLLAYAALVTRVTGAGQVCLVTDWIGPPPSGLAALFGGLPVEVHASLAPGEDVLLERARRSSGAVLVVPRDAPGGVTAAALAARATVPVWMVPHGQSPHLAELLVATDLSPAGEAAYRAAVALAARAGARCDVLHVYWREPGERDCAECGHAARDREAAEVRAFVAAHPAPGVALAPQVREDMHVATGVQAAAEAAAADLVVMGRRGWNRTRAALLGSSTADVLRLSTRPVLVVPDVSGGLSP